MLDPRGINFPSAGGLTEGLDPPKSCGAGAAATRPPNKTADVLMFSTIQKTMKRMNEWLSQKNDFGTAVKETQN